MKYKYWVTGLLTAAAIFTAGAIALDLGAREPAQTGAEPTANRDLPSSSATATQLPNSVASTLPGASKPEPSMDPKNTSTPSTKSVPSTKGGKADRGSDRPLLEVPEPTAKSSPGLPKSTPRSAMLNSVPKTGHENGKLVKGFPWKQLPLPGSSDVVKSSVTTQGERVIAEVTGRTSKDADKVVKFYRSYFAKLDWSVEETAAADGTKRLLGQFADDSTSIQIRSLPTGLTQVTASGSYAVGK